jgi:hypothetical protein
MLCRMRTETRKATSKSALAARARMLYTADLGWLEGFPLELLGGGGGVRWLAVPASAPAHEVSVEGLHLSRATTALNKLRGELAPGLERLAEEPDAWGAAVERRLALLKGAVHGDAPLPPDLLADPGLARALRDKAAALAAAEPGLRPLLGALSWVHAGHPARLRAALDLIAGWSPGGELLAERLGERPALLVLLRLAQLAESHGRERVRALAACLFDERLHDAALGQSDEFCGQILAALGKRARAPLPGDLPGGRLGRDLADWCEDLVQQSHRAQRQALHLFELAAPGPLVESWALWWRTTRQLLREARDLHGLPYQRESRRALRERLERPGRRRRPRSRSSTSSRSCGGPWRRTAPLSCSVSSRSSLPAKSIPGGLISSSTGAFSAAAPVRVRRGSPASSATCAGSPCRTRTCSCPGAR